MVGQTFPSEKRTYIDPKTGYEITQLTNQGINFAMYFTDNSFDEKNENIYFLSNRPNYDSEITNLFKMNLATGEMVQLTDDPEGIEPGRVTKSRNGEYLAYITGRQVHLITVATGENKVIHEEKDMIMNMVFFNCDNTKLGMTRNEDCGAIPDNGPNYLGFKEKMFLTKDARVSVMNIDGSDFHDVFRDTHWLGHFQFSPDDPDIASFCHEGPWNYVQQRIWVINMKTGDVWPCFRQVEDDCVGHEFWSQGGDIIFDNRRGGHDGTISNTKEQVFAVESVTKGVPYFGFAHRDGKVYRKVDMPYYCNHYFGNSDLSLFVGDAIEDIVLIRPQENGDPKILSLANHNTTWHYQRSHCHPCFSWDDKMVIYSADTDRMHDNVFIVKVPEDF